MHGNLDRFAGPQGFARLMEDYRHFTTAKFVLAYHFVGPRGGIRLCVQEADEQLAQAIEAFRARKLAEIEKQQIEPIATTAT